MPEYRPAEVTESQYRAAMDALGLDADRVSNLSLSGDHVSYSLVRTDEDGVPEIALGRVIVDQYGGPLVSGGEATDE